VLPQAKGAKWRELEPVLVTFENNQAAGQLNIEEPTEAKVKVEEAFILMIKVIAFYT
jgi:hypothetical protein